jgi:hypothetical protein
MRNSGREFIVGLVFFLLLGALAVITLKTGTDQFSSKEAMTLRFDDVAGLAKGSEVWINGLPSGTVREIGIAPDGIVTATARMRNKVSELDLSKGVAVEVKDKSSLGGAVVSIRTLKEADPKAPKSLEEIQARTWSAKAGGLSAVGEGAVNSLIKGSDDKPGFLGKALLGDDGLKDLNASLADLKETLKEVKTWIEGADKDNSLLAVLLKDKEAGDRLKKTIANFEEMTTKANTGDGLLGKLLNDAETGKKFDRIVDGLEKFSVSLKNEEGSLYKFMNDGTVFEDVKKAVADIKEFTGGMNDEKGTLHRLMHDEKLANNIDETITSAKASFDELKTIATDVKEGKGTLGKLVNDPSLYNELKDTLATLKRTFEEGRENAPILTFAGFLFRTF